MRAAEVAVIVFVRTCNNIECNVVGTEMLSLIDNDFPQLDFFKFIKPNELHAK